MIVLLALQAAAPLQPAGKWVADYRDGDCAISRRFGDAAAPRLFGFRPRPTSMIGQVVMTVPEAGGTKPEAGRGSVALTPGDTRFAMSWVAVPLAQGGRAVRFEMDGKFWDALPDAVAISVQLGEQPPVSLALGAMKPVLAAAKACNDDLLRGWGADPAAMVQQPAYAAREWFGPANYPSAALASKQQGRVQSVTSFDRAGKPVACKVVASSGSESLDHWTCSAIKRRGYLPLVGAEGPATRYVYTAVNWRLDR